MYREKRFRVKPMAQIEADIREAAQGPQLPRLFLCDGDALILKMERLMPILKEIRKQLPWVERVSCYGDTRSLARKSSADLKALRAAGLGMVYHGLESGDDEVLRRVEKGGTAAEALKMAQALKMAGIQHSVILLLGLGGVERSLEHAQATAALLSQMDPPYVGALTLTLIPGTPLFEEEQAGRFQLPDKFGLLEEMRILLAESKLSACRFSSNHASNYLPMRAQLPQDRELLLNRLDAVLESRDEHRLKPEWMRGL